MVTTNTVELSFLFFLSPFFFLSCFLLGFPGNFSLQKGFFPLGFSLGDLGQIPLNLKVIVPPAL